MSVWFDVKKESLPNNVTQVLARIKDEDNFYFVILTRDKKVDEEYPWFFDKPYNDGSFFNDNGEIDWGTDILTHWQYIDPTGITE